MERSAEEIARIAVDKGKIPLWSKYRDGISIADLADFVKRLGEHDDNFTLLTNFIRLHNHLLRRDEQPDPLYELENDTLRALRLRIQDIISPPSPQERPYAKGHTSRTTQTGRLVVEEGLRLLILVDRHAQSKITGTDPVNDDSVDTWVMFASFTDPSDDWTSAEAASIAQEHSRELVQTSTDTLSTIVGGILHRRVKPIFSKSRNTALTLQGRKAIDPLPAKFESISDERNLKPWRFSHPSIVTIFQWTMAMMNETLIEKYWPLIIPPILTLIDDSCIEVKVKGCKIASDFFDKVPRSKLHRTGVGEVFNEALMPCLLYLPSLTEEDDSIKLLGAAYPALFALTTARFSSSGDRAMRVQALNSIVRDAIFRGFAHAGEHFRIAALLFRQLQKAISELGLAASVHLKSIMPLIHGILTQPLITMNVALLNAALNTLKELIVRIWPRLSEYRLDIWRVLAICWIRVDESEGTSKEFKGTKETMQQIARALKDAANSNKDLEVGEQILVSVNKSLKELFVSHYPCTNRAVGSCGDENIQADVA